MTRILKKPGMKGYWLRFLLSSIMEKFDVIVDRIHFPKKLLPRYKGNGKCDETPLIDFILTEGVDEKYRGTFK